MKNETIYNATYWIKKGYSKEDAQKKSEHLKRETSWRCKEFWIKRGYSEEEALVEISSKQKEIALKKDRNKKSKNPYSNEYYIEKGITDPDKIVELINELKDKTNMYKVCSKEQIENILKKRKETYYSKTKEERNKINKSRGLNKEEIIKKFGIEKSLEIFRNRGNGTRMPYEKKFSKISLTLFNDLKKLNPDKTFVYGKDEKFILVKDNQNKNGYYVDFYFEKEKKIIEFNGDFWHFNPKKYLSESFTILNNVKVCAKDVWEKDKIKIDSLKNNNYNVLVIWEIDYKEDKEEILKICNKFLNEKI